MFGYTTGAGPAGRSDQMNIVVCIKAVPDPEKADQIKIDPETGTLIRTDIPVVLNPLDKFALEQALELKRSQEAHITVLSMGPPSSEAVLKECMALGADKGVLLCDPALGGADAYATALTLAQGIRKLGQTDLVLCGMASSDGATEWVGPQIASFLEMPVVTMAHQVEEIEENSWIVRADFENGYRRIRIKLPAVITVTRELNQPKALSFSGIIKARKKQVQMLTLNDLGIEPELVGAKGSPTIVSKMEPVTSTRKVTMLEGNREEKAEQLLKILNDFRQAR